MDLIKTLVEHPEFKEIIKTILIDNLEVKVETPEDRLEISLVLFGEVISSDFCYRRG